LNLLKELDKDFSGEISFAEFKYVVNLSSGLRF